MMQLDELREILQLSVIQRQGGYSTESDAMAALELIARLTREIIVMRQEMGLDK